MKKKIMKGIGILFVFLFVVIAVFPLLATVTNSFMSVSEVVDRYVQNTQTENLRFVRLGLIPDRVSLEQYRTLLFVNPVYLRMVWNSLILVLPILAGQLVIAPLAAYGFERMRWRHKEVLFFFYVVVMLMPMQVLLVPHFIVSGWLGIRESYLAIILPAIFHPLGVFLIRQQIKGFPGECLEAARLDGAGEYAIYRRIMRPNMSGILAALMVLLFTDNWNIVDQAVVFIQNSFEEPMSVYLSRILTSDPGMFYAASAFYALPALLVFFVGQDYLIEGISMSGIKS